MSIPSRRSRIMAAVAALVVLLIAGTAPVFAHAELVSSDPADGAQVSTAPTTITLTFSEGVVGRSSFNLILNGETIGTGKAAKDGDTTMTVDGLSLEPGAYTIQWTSVADDGDLLRGSVKFTVLAATAAPSTAASPTAAPSAEASSTPAPTPVAADSPSPQASADSAPASSSGSDVLLPIIIGLLIVAGVGAFLLQRSRRA